MATLRRGIAPDLLLTQVKNTMPYLFEPEAADSALGRFPAAQVLRAFAEAPGQELTHFEYFRLCLSSHYLSCATPVPTDVDNQIRQKLWPAELPLETALEMTDLVLSSRAWDFTQVSDRCAYGAQGTPWQKQPLSGHLGEWFTVASGAYCALKQYKAEPAQKKREEILAAILDEVRRHSEVFASLWKAQDGLGCLKAAAAIAHNFGDLDRVMDMWSLGVEDPLRLECYHLGVKPFDTNGKLRHLGRLWTAGELYKSVIQGSSMALENHRHFALRKPRCLRQSRKLLIPTGPFFDDWGHAVAETLASDGQPSEGTVEVVEALCHGWVRLPRTMAYGRALRSMIEVHPGLVSHSDVAGLSKDHARRTVLGTHRERFEKAWNEGALKELDDIPSRA